MKFKKHTLSYPTYHIGRAGKDFKCQFISKNTKEFGGTTPAHDLDPTFDSSSTFDHLLPHYRTALNPFPIKPATLNQLTFEDAPDDFGNTKTSEAKYPDMFRFRYLFPVYYSVSVIVRRCRIVFDTDETHTEFNPSAADLLVTEQAMDFPCVFYWRADVSNLVNFSSPGFSVGMYLGQNSNWNSDAWYNPANSLSPTFEPGAQAQHLFDSLSNRRWKKCTVLPKTNCQVKLGVHCNSMAPTGKLPDLHNTDYWGGPLWNAPVSAFVRNFWNRVGISGQTDMGGQASYPGDLYLLMQAPEIDSRYMALINNKPTEVTPGASARLVFDYDVKTQLILRGLERHFDNIQAGGVVPAMP